MAAHGSIPVWLLDSKVSITNSKEWNDFLQELYDAVDQELKESHVPSFSDLTDAERVMFIERARNVIQGGLSYGKLYGQVSSILDRDLNKAVSRQQIEDLAAETKTDLILDCALDGSVGLLNKWPDLRSKLHAFLNHPLPQQLRPVAWRLYLEDSKLRRKYLQTLATDPWSAVSSLDRDISNTCEELLKIDEFLDEFHGSVGVFYAMKAVLSYYHALKCGPDPLHRTYYNLIFPFILVSTPSLPRKEPAPSHIVALLTEEYFTFTSSLPHFIHNIIAKVDDHSANVFASRVATCLKSINADIDLSLTSNLFFQNEDDVSRESVDAKDSVRKTGNQTILADTVQSLVMPVVQNMFVGYVQRDVLLYIWDQYIIGLDSSGFTDDYLPAITAVFLKLADDRVKASKQVKTTLAKEGKKLTVPQFQYEMNKNFHDELFARLKQEARAALPVLDPTQAIDQRWLKWFDDQTIQNVTSRDHRSQLKVKHADNRNKSELDSKSLHHSQLEDQQLAEKLAQERRRREDGERIAAQEISRLRQELHELNRQKLRNLSSSTPISTTSHLLIVPPPTAVSRPSPAFSPYQPRATSQPANTELRTPRHQTPPKQTSTAMTDFLKRVVKGFDRVAHGEGYQKEQLDKKTKKSVKNHREDLKNAEIVIFGREFAPGEFEQLPLATREEKTHDMMELIHKQMIERRKQQLTSGVR